MSNGDVQFDYAQIGGVKLHYAKAGTGERLVLLLHGFPEFWYSWRHQLAALSTEYTVVAPDIRGYNLSDKPPRVEDYKMDNLVDDVLGLIHYFGYEQAAIIAHDGGAGIAWAVAEKHPEMVWKLACLQVPPLFVWQKNQTLKQALASWYMFFYQIPCLPEWVLSRNDFMLAEMLCRNAAADYDFFTAENMKEYKRTWREPGALTSMINFYRANFWDKFVKKQEPVKIKVPTLFIYGEKDAAVLPETIKNIGEVIDAPYSEVRIPHSGHWVQQEAAEIVTDTLQEFLKE